MLLCSLVLLVLASTGALTGSTKIVGAPTEFQANKNDAEVILAMQGINDYFDQEGDKDNRTIVKIIKATSQASMDSVSFESFCLLFWFCSTNIT